MKKTLLIVALILSYSGIQAQKKYSKKKIEALKTEAAEIVQSKAKLSQEMVDIIDSTARCK